MGSQQRQDEAPWLIQEICQSDQITMTPKSKSGFALSSLEQPKKIGETLNHQGFPNLAIFRVDFNIAPENRVSQKETIVFQPSIFQGLC